MPAAGDRGKSVLVRRISGSCRLARRTSQYASWLFSPTTAKYPVRNADDNPSREIAVPSPAVQPLLALLSSHVGGNPAQYMFEQAFAHHGLDWRYLTLEIAPENLGDAVRGLRALGFRGGHCADPHKQAVLAWLDRATETATMVGAVNLIFREENALVGENTEGKGVVQTIRGGSIWPASGWCCWGPAAWPGRWPSNWPRLAWPASRSSIVPKAGPVNCVALLADKFEVPVSAVPWHGDYVVPPETDLVIQATSIGHDATQAELPLVLDSLRPELVDGRRGGRIPPTTGCLSQAAQRGCQTVDGLSMFIEQAAIGFQLWTGVDPSRQVLREAVEEFLEL